MSNIKILKVIYDEVSIAPHRSYACKYINLKTLAKRYEYNRLGQQLCKRLVYIIILTYILSPFACKNKKKQQPS